jgi:hypothetical protein
MIGLNVGAEMIETRIKAPGKRTIFIYVLKPVQANHTVPNQNTSDPTSFVQFDSACPGRVIQYRLKLLF